MPTHLGPVELPRISSHFLSLRRAVRAHRTDEPITVGLSGGADSLGLVAAALAEGLKVHAMCVDHGLQEASAEVSARAAELARSMGANAEVVAVQVAPGNLEANAREARYAALTQPGRPVWVAHTMDDQAETYLLAALRGNPGGMLPVSYRGKATVVRPLLQVRRADTVGACAELGLNPWHDPHNADPAFLRVALRHIILPALRTQAGADPVPALAQAAERAALQADFLATQVVEPTVANLQNVHPAVRQASVAKLVHDAVGKVSWPVVRAAERLVTDWHGQGPVAIGGADGARVGVARVGDQLEIRPL